MNVLLQWGIVLTIAVVAVFALVYLEDRYMRIIRSFRVRGQG